MVNITLTKYISTEPLSKKYWLEAGEIKKQAAAQMVTGTAERVTMPFAEFTNALAAADSNTAFGYGLHAPELSDKVVITLQGHENPGKGIISRTKDCFTYQGAGVLMLDHDPSPYGKNLTPDGLIVALTAIHPAFANAASVVRGSVSAGVHLKGGQPRNDKGFHVYLPVANAADIPRYGKALFGRLWLAGHGFIALSANGSCLVRTCIDGSVFSPERLDFAGKPVLTGEGLQYTPPETVYTDGGYLDTSTLPDLTDDEAVQVDKLIANAKAAIGGQAQAKREEWAGDKVKTMVAAGVPADKARAIIADMLKGGCKDLYGDFPLYFGSKNVTVNEVLDNAKAYDGKSLSDPIEGREYGTTTAKFYWNNGDKPVINSLAHGVETRYFLHSDSEATANDRKLKELAGLRPIEYDRQRKDAAKELGISVKTLDAEVRAIQVKQDEAEEVPFPEINPWHESVDPAELLEELTQAVKRFVVVDDNQVIGCALWLLMTYFVDVIDIAALLIVNAPAPECGKTILLNLLAKLAWRPMSTDNASPSTLFRSVEEWRPTLFIDEADTFFRDNLELHGIVNAGYAKTGYVLRTETINNSFKVKRFSVYAAKAIAGIALEKHLPAATMSRGIEIGLKRKLKGEKVERLRYAGGNYFTRLTSKMRRFADDYADRVQETRITLPEALSDRQQDNFEPLLIIASIAGKDWLCKATDAAWALSGNTDKNRSISHELLTDIKAIFDAKPYAEFLPTLEMIGELCKDDDAPWRNYSKGNPLTGRQLSKLLEPYSIVPGRDRLSTTSNPKRGYTVADFADVFERYLGNEKDIVRPLHGRQKLRLNG
jgi:putative DNA primase/helicase